MSMLIMSLCTQDTGVPPIVAAASEGHTEVVRCLLDWGDNPNHAAQVRFVSQLVSASLVSHKLMQPVCVQKRAEPDCLLCHDDSCTTQSGGMTPLMFASMRGYTKTMKLLLDCQADPDLRDDVPHIALHAYA